MWRGLAIACALAGCRFQVPDRALDDAGGNGSDGPPPVDMPPDAPPLPGDRDGDGVKDATDRCPDVFDPLQRDKDNDGFGDACDGCPPFASSTNDDGDGDGVGDACDPHPTAAGDKIAVWLGFYDEDEGRVVALTKSGMWSVSGEALHTNNSPSSNSLIRAAPVIGRAVQFTHVVLDDFSSSSAAVAMESGEVITGGNLTQLYQCALFRSPAEVRAKSIVGDQPLDDQGVAWTGAVSNGTEIDMASQFTSAFRCTVAPPQTPVAAIDDVLAGQVELFVQRADASFSYWFVIDAAP